MAADFRSSRHEEIEDHVSIQVIPEENLVPSIVEKMEKVSLSGSICRVPDELLKENKEEFLPKLVSIGPLHHGKVEQAMENLKWRYLNALLERKPDIEQTLDACVKTLKNLEWKARKCYTENLDHIGSNEFVQMMLVDGCFIIELFLKFAIKSMRRRDDPCFAKNEQFFRLRCDLILLENQIPFFVLQQLFHLVPVPKKCSHSLIELALCFFRKLIPGDEQIPQEKFGPDVHHLLDLIRQYFLPAIPEVQSHSMQKCLPSAAGLKAAGINFYDANAETLLNIKFKNGMLEIPPLKIHKRTAILFKNLVALECCSCASPKHVTSYVLLMKQLIQTKQDVRILHQRQILINGLEKQEEIIHLFKNFDNLDIKVEDFYYRWLSEKIDEHVKMKGQRHWCQKMKDFYEKSPFGVAGFSFAIVLVVSIFTAALFGALALFMHHVN